MTIKQEDFLGTQKICIYLLNIPIHYYLMEFGTKGDRTQNTWLQHTFQKSDHKSWHLLGARISGDLGGYHYTFLREIQPARCLEFRWNPGNGPTLHKLQIYVLKSQLVRHYNFLRLKKLFSRIYLSSLMINQSSIQDEIK